MKNKIKNNVHYFVRQKDGSLWLFKDPPLLKDDKYIVNPKNKDLYEDDNCYVLKLCKNDFIEIKFKNSPVEVECTEQNKIIYNKDHYHEI